MGTLLSSSTLKRLVQRDFCITGGLCRCGAFVAAAQEVESPVLERLDRGRGRGWWPGPASTTPNVNTTIHFGRRLQIRIACLL